QVLAATPKPRRAFLSWKGSTLVTSDPERTCPVANNLTREEARDRGQLVSVESYHVALDLAGPDETFESVTTVRFGCARPGASTFVELTAPAVTGITLNGL